MSLFWKRSERVEAEKEAEKASSIEVVEIKRKAHKTAEQTNRDIKKLNDLLQANGITLKIHIATGGRHK